MKKCKKQKILCETVGKLITYKFTYERLGTTDNWPGRRECQFYFECPYKATCTNHFVPIRRTQ